MFKFKQFSIQQGNSAMKVCTDACLFGALISLDSSKNALDIGTGTGLLSLMVAQKYPELNIDAVEIDAGAVTDAAINFKESPFAERISLFHRSIQSFSAEISKTYDVIFSNPPFYENQLKSPNSVKNLAHHASQLSFQELLNVVAQLLKHEGVLWILLPPTAMSNFTELAANKLLFIQKHFFIRHDPSKPVFREVVSLSFNQTKEPYKQEINIYENGKYSSIFTSFMRDYYLIF